MSFLASNSDVEAVPHRVAQGARSIHLNSEQFTESPEGCSFTTTAALLAMFEEYWAELRLRDGDSGSLGVKMKCLFKSSIMRESLKTYSSPDDKLAMEPPAVPNVAYSWLPAPAKRIDIDERDVVFLERNARATCRALNFAEVVLQAWSPAETSVEMATRMRRSISKAVKAMMQLQVVSACSLLHLRRDHHLAAVRGLSVDLVQRLRHAPVVGEAKLFPSDMLKEINDANYQSLQTRAILKATRSEGSSATARKNQDQRPGFAYNNYLPQHQPRRDNYGFNRYFSVVKSRIPVTSCSSSAPRAHDNMSRCRDDAQSFSVVKMESPAGGGDSVQLLESFEWEAQQLQRQAAIPVGGRLRFFWKEWRAIGAPKRIARWLNRGYRLPFELGAESEARALLSTHCPATLIPSYSPTSEKGRVLKEMMATLLEKQVIEVIQFDQLAFFNVVFLRPKPGGKWRLILDVSRLNKFLVTASFKMDTVQVIRQAVEEDSWATSIDLTDAYHHIPVHENYRCFLAFQVGATRYRYCACPFGLSPLPQVFTVVSEVVKSFLRKQWQCGVFQYIDDWLFMSRSRERVAGATRAFVRLCIRLGLLVNMSKSVLQPARQIVHLGMLWDFQHATLRPSDKRVDDIVTTAQRVAAASRYPLQLLESLMGKLVSVESAVPFGRLNYRTFQRQLVSELKYGRSFRWVKLAEGARVNVRWWARRLHLLTTMSVRPPAPTMVIHTDASTLGWGASCDGATLKGVWSLQEKRLHINLLEMIAVKKTMSLWSSALASKVICFRIDNISVVYYLNKQGGTRSAELCREAEAVLRLAQSLDITVQASHIRGDLNVLADMLSRENYILKNEWRLSPETFRWVCGESVWGAPTLDLFANRLNHQTQRFLSPCQDEQAVGTDALLCRWPPEVCYAFPPTTLMQRVVAKILQERPSRLLLVAPWWPMVPWFPTLQSRAMKVVLIPAESLRLCQPHFQCDMHCPMSLSLALWHISFRV